MAVGGRDHRTNLPGTGSGKARGLSAEHSEIACRLGFVSPMGDDLGEVDNLPVD